MAALVEYIALFYLPDEHPSGSIWPTFKNDEFLGEMC